MSGAADDKARELVETIRCAKINFENVEHMVLGLAADPHWRLAKHQLDCAVAIANGEPEPELR